MGGGIHRPSPHRTRLVEAIEIESWLIRGQRYIDDFPLFAAPVAQGNVSRNREVVTHAREPTLSSPFRNATLAGHGRREQAADNGGSRPRHGNYRCQCDRDPSCGQAISGQSPCRPRRTALPPGETTISTTNAESASPRAPAATRPTLFRARSSNSSAQL